MTKPRVLIAFKNPQAENPLACHVGLGVTAGNEVDTLNEYGVNAELFPVIDGYYLRRKLRDHDWAFGITHVVMCAPFFDSKFLESLLEEFKGIRFTVVFHSNVGFLGVDNWSMGVLGEQIWLQKKYSNFCVSGNSKKFCRAVKEAFGVTCNLLPNLYFLHGEVTRPRGKWNGCGPLKIGAFGATRVLKNLPTAAWAAQIIARRLNVPVEFYVSGGREEGKGAGGVIDNCQRLYSHCPGIKLIQAPWLPWLDFKRHTVRQMHLLLQPSFTESFNGVTADGVMEGVASVVSHAIDWVPDNWKANADDATEMALTGIELLKNPKAPAEGYRKLAEHNEEAVRCWREYLGVRKKLLLGLIFRPT